MIVCAECGKPLDIEPDVNDETWLCSKCSRLTQRAPDRACALAGDETGETRAAGEA